MIRCFKCNSELNVLIPVARSETCAKCGAYVRCCKNCKFYDEFAHNRCREPNADLVADKENSNFCDWFGPAERGAVSKNTAQSAENAKSKFDALFKK